MINLQATNLTLSDQSKIENSVNSHNGNRQAGDTRITVTGTTEITGSRIESSILEEGKGGLINLNTGTLNLNNQGSIAINPWGCSAGQGSLLKIYADESVIIDSAFIIARDVNKEHSINSRS